MQKKLKKISQALEALGRDAGVPLSMVTVDVHYYSEYDETRLSASLGWYAGPKQHSHNYRSIVASTYHRHTKAELLARMADAIEEAKRTQYF